MRRSVLVVDDDRSIRTMVKEYLTSDGFDVETVDSGAGAVQAVRRRPPDVVLLDVMLPDIDGVEVLRQIRRFSDVYVIMVTARSEEIDTIVALSVGADDYVTKPFSPRELSARISTILRRSRTGTDAGEEVMSRGNLVIDPTQRTVTLHGDFVELTTLEFDLLATLARTPGRVYTRRQLLEQVWGWDFYGDERVVDVHIRNIRKHLGDDASAPSVIATVRGVGYRFLPGWAP